jgi:hypothetical protein
MPAAHLPGSQAIPIIVLSVPDTQTSLHTPRNSRIYRRSDASWQEKRLAVPAPLIPCCSRSRMFPRYTRFRGRSACLRLRTLSPSCRPTGAPLNEGYHSWPVTMPISRSSLSKIAHLEALPTSTRSCQKGLRTQTPLLGVAPATTIAAKLSLIARRVRVMQNG